MWTEEQRQRQAANVRKSKAWTASTGPKTAEGKAKVAQNALKHGLRGGIFRRATNLLSQNNKLLKGLR